eukprot:COSAG01_NODE_109_length_25925_cov_48.384961_34_plen_108_part_00
MSRSDGHIKELLEQVKEHDEMYTIVDNNKVLVEYSGEELDDMEDIPGWEYIMKVAEKLYNEFETEFETGIYHWDMFDYGPDRFMAWSTLAKFIEDIKEQKEIDATYE